MNTILHILHDLTEKTQIYFYIRIIHISGETHLKKRMLLMATMIENELDEASRSDAIFRGSVCNGCGNAKTSLNILDRCLPNRNLRSTVKPVNSELDSVKGNVKC